MYKAILITDHCLVYQLKGTHGMLKQHSSVHLKVTSRLVLSFIIEI